MATNRTFTRFSYGSSVFSFVTYRKDRLKSKPAISLPTPISLSLSDSLGKVSYVARAINTRLLNLTW